MGGGFRLLSDADPAPVEVVNRSGSAPFVLTCEHAGRTIPHRLEDMGLSERDRERHIAWDIGAGALARRMAAMLDAPLVLQRYSRLVIDCNRPLHVDTSIPEQSDGTPVAANSDLAPAERAARAREIHTPYHDAIAAVLDERASGNRRVAVVAVHSFTPRLELDPDPRPWDIGLLHNRHRELATLLHDALAVEASHLEKAFNEPYRVDDLEDFTIPVHGERRGLPNVLLEVRNDHIAAESGQRAWAELLSRALGAVVARLWRE